MGIGGNINSGGQSNNLGGVVPISTSNGPSIINLGSSISGTAPMISMLNTGGFERARLTLDNTANKLYIEVRTDNTFNTTRAVSLDNIGNFAVNSTAQINSILQSTSTNTGALQVAGGVGIGGSVFVGGITNITSIDISDSTYTGALIVAGGVGVGGNLNVGGNFSVAASTAIVNSRINSRTTTTASTPTLTPNISMFDQYNLTAQAEALSVAAPIGTPVDGNRLIFRILDNGTARALAWTATYTVIGVTLPTTTVINKTTYVGCIYNANNTRWDVIAVTTQA